MECGHCSDVSSGSPKSNKSNPPPLPPKPPPKVTRQSSQPIPSSGKAKVAERTRSPVSTVVKYDEISEYDKSPSSQSESRKRFTSTPGPDWKLPSDHRRLLGNAATSTSPTDRDKVAAISLDQFVLQYSHMLPIHVKILKGCGPVLHTGKVYNIHVVKRLKV